MSETNLLEIGSYVLILFLPLYTLLVVPKFSESNKKRIANVMFFSYWFYMVVCLFGVLGWYPRYDLNHLGGVGIFWGLIYLILTLNFLSNREIPRIDGMLLGLGITIPLTELWETPIHILTILNRALYYVLITLMFVVPQILVLIPFYVMLKRTYKNANSAMLWLGITTIVYSCAWIFSPVNLYNILELSMGTYVRMIYVIPVLIILGKLGVLKDV